MTAPNPPQAQQAKPPPDPWLSGSEILARDVDRMLAKGGVRAGGLRPQISVDRLSLDPTRQASAGKVLAKIKVDVANGVRCAHSPPSSLAFWCIVDPTATNSAHALIAMIANPSDRDSMTEGDRIARAIDLRARLAELFHT